MLDGHRCQVPGCVRPRGHAPPHVDGQMAELQWQPLTNEVVVVPNIEPAESIADTEGPDDAPEAQKRVAENADDDDQRQKRPRRGVQVFMADFP